MKTSGETPLTVFLFVCTLVFFLAMRYALCAMQSLTSQTFPTCLALETLCCFSVHRHCLGKQQCRLRIPDTGPDEPRKFLSENPSPGPRRDRSRHKSRIRCRFLHRHGRSTDLASVDLWKEAPELCSPSPKLEKPYPKYLSALDHTLQDKFL